MKLGRNLGPLTARKKTNKPSHLFDGLGGGKTTALFCYLVGRLLASLKVKYQQPETGLPATDGTLINKLITLCACVCVCLYKEFIPSKWPARDTIVSTHPHV